MSVKNASVVVYYYAENTSTGQPETGDEGNHTLRVAEAGVVSTLDGAPAPQELDATYFPGFYYVTVPASDNGADTQMLGGTSSTPNVVIRPVVWTNDDYSVDTLATAVADLQASVDAITSLIQGTTIVATSSSSIESGLLTLVRGDSYDNILNPKITFTFSSAVDCTGAAASITIRNVDTDVIELEVATGVVSLISGTDYLATFELASTDTEGLTPGISQGKFDIELADSGSVRTVVTGKVTVIEDQTRPGP